MKQYAIILAIFLCSCNKENIVKEKNVVKKSLPSLESLLKFNSDKNGSGGFLINFSSAIGTKDINELTVNINGAYLNKQTQAKELGGTNYFNGLAIECSKDGNSYYNGDFSLTKGGELFGKNLNLGLNRSSSPNSVGDSVYNYNGGYVPEIFLISNNIERTVANANFEYISGTTLQPGFRFNWNKDSLNNNGVFIYLEYNPNTIGNEAFKTRFPNQKANGVLVDDNGSYRLTSDLFDDLPLNALITVHIGRGNFQYITQTDGTVTDMQITAITYQYDNMFYKDN